MYGNINAPPAVTYSAIIYSLRCMVCQEIPLNQVLPVLPVLALSCVAQFGRLPQCLRDSPLCHVLVFYGCVCGRRDA